MTSWLDINRPFPTVVLQAVGLLVLVLAWFVLGTALFTRRWLLAAVASVLCITHVALVAPLVRRDPLPAWAASADTITVGAANLLYLNKQTTEATITLAHSGADVLVLTEVTTQWIDAFRTGGLLDQYRYQVLTPYDDAGIGSAILSTRPYFAEHADKAYGRVVHSIDIDVGGTLLQIVALHPQSPSSGELVSSWRLQIRELESIVDRRTGPIALVGDLNASYLHPPYRLLMKQTGLTDAHAAVGRGWTTSFPADGGLIPRVTRLDHALVSNDLAVLSVRDMAIPGSDHSGFVTQLAVRPKIN